MEDDVDPKKKHWIAIPPTAGDRVDVIPDALVKKGVYCFDFKGIIIKIKNGTPIIVELI
jgi:hypothetical protein